MTEDPNGGTAHQRPSTDVLVGAAIVLAALAVGLEALTFDTSFPTDPLGPKAFPLVASALLILGGGWVLARPGSARGEPVRGVVWAASASFALYALALNPLGFVLSTVLGFVALSMLFGGRPLRACAAGTAFAVALYLLFVQGLGLPLPVGSIFVIGG